MQQLEEQQLKNHEIVTHQHALSIASTHNQLKYSKLIKGLDTKTWETSMRNELRRFRKVSSLQKDEILLI